MTISKKTLATYNNLMACNGREYLCIGEEWDKFKVTDADRELAPKTMADMLHEVEHLIWCTEQDINEYYWDDDEESKRGRKECRQTIRRCKAFIKAHEGERE